MAPITVSRVLCGLLFLLGTFALLADTTKPGSGQLSKAENTTFSTARRLATVSTATPAPLVVRSTRTTTVFSTAIVTPVSTISTTITAAPAVVVVTAEPAPAPTPSLLHAAPLPDDLGALYHNRDNKLLTCYPLGWWDARWKFIKSIETFCHALDRESSSSGGPNGRHRVPLTGYRQHSYNWEQQLRLVVNSHYEISLDVKPGCEWEFDAYECGRYLRIPVDMCETGGENDKKGGVVQARTGYGDLDTHKNEWTGAMESVWRGDKELEKHGEARLGDLEKKGMSRTCLVWRIDLDTYHVDHAEPVDGTPDGIGRDPWEGGR